MLSEDHPFMRSMRRQRDQIAQSVRLLPTNPSEDAITMMLSEANEHEAVVSWRAAMLISNVYELMILHDLSCYMRSVMMSGIVIEYFISCPLTIMRYLTSERISTLKVLSCSWRPLFTLPSNPISLPWQRLFDPVFHTSFMAIVPNFFLCCFLLFCGHN